MVRDAVRDTVMERAVCEEELPGVIGVDVSSDRPESAMNAYMDSAKKTMHAVGNGDGNIKYAVTPDAGRDDVRDDEGIPRALP